jgi:hypothetical protein
MQKAEIEGGEYGIHKDFGAILEGTFHTGTGRNDIIR